MTNFLQTPSLAHWTGPERIDPEWPDIVSAVMAALPPLEAPKFTLPAQRETFLAWLEAHQDHLHGPVLRSNDNDPGRPEAYTAVAVWDDPATGYARPVTLHLDFGDPLCRTVEMMLCGLPARHPGVGRHAHPGMGRHAHPGMGRHAHPGIGQTAHPLLMVDNRHLRSAWMAFLDPDLSCPSGDPEPLRQAILAGRAPLAADNGHATTLTCPLNGLPLAIFHHGGDRGMRHASTSLAQAIVTLAADRRLAVDGPAVDLDTGPQP